MAINWKHSKKFIHWNKNSLSRGCTIIAVLLLIAAQVLVSIRFDSSTIFHMIGRSYRTDNAYMDVYCEAFHGIVHEVLYQEGCYFEEDVDALKEDVAQANNMNEALLYAASGRHDAGEYTIEYSGKSSTYNLSAYLEDIGLKRYAIGNAFSGDRVTAAQGKKDNPVVLYANKNNYVTGIHKKQNAKADVTERVETNLGNADSAFIEESVNAYFEKNTPITLDQISVNRNKGIADDGYYVLSDQSGEYRAALLVGADETAVDEDYGDYEDYDLWIEYESGTVYYKDISGIQVTNLVYAPCKVDTSIYPILYYTPDNNHTERLLGNEKYVARYKELYGNEKLYMNTYSTAKQEAVLRNYKNGENMTHEKNGGVESTVTKAINYYGISTGLFIDATKMSESGSGTIAQLEGTAAVARGSMVCSLGIFILGLILSLMEKSVSFAEIKRKCNARMLSVPYEIHMAIALLSVYVLAVIMPGDVEDIGILCARIIGVILVLIYDFWFLKNVLINKKKTALRSICITHAEKIADRKKEKYGLQNKQGFAYYLYLKTQQVVFSESVLLAFGALCGLAQGIWFAYGREPIDNMIWYGPFVVAVLVVLIIYVFADYIRFGIKYMKGLAFVQNQIERMGRGDFDTMEEVPAEFSGFDIKQHLDGIQEAVHKSMENEMKSERMKVELIANVSHDIKTPLTSIINYVDLLSDMDELPAIASDYVAVLQRKSYRLKTMIQDLFDLSKASSGNLPIEQKEINYTKLVQQTLADMDELIEASTLTFRVNLEENVRVYTDGNRMYRVLQNLINNALLYSMEHSRVYISLETAEDEVIFKIQNTSKAELNYTKEQIMERFFRGDKSRSTEGSGLGVAIANSFTQVCGGTFDIAITADLFSAVIVFPKMK